MCGGINIFYGIKEIEYENSGQAPDPNVTFQIHELEGKDWPLPNDLILNSDGCFYRVETVAEEGIATVRLTLQGTGGGGSGSGGGGGTGSATYSINVTPQVNIFSSQDEEMIIKFQGIAEQPTETYITRVAFTIGAAESELNQAFHVEEGYYEIGTLANPIIHSVDLAKYKDLFGASAMTLYLNTTDVYGVNRSKKFTIQVVDLFLTEYEKPIFKSVEDSHSFSCVVGGAKTGISNKKIIISIYNEDNLNAPIINPPQEVSVENGFNGQKTCLLDLKSLPHGVYVLKVQMTANITGSEKIISSNILTHKLIRFIPGSAGALFAINVPKEIEQYTNTPMEFMIASDEENKNYTVDISIDGISKTNLIATTNTLKSYPLYFENKGNYALTATVVEMSNLTQTFLIKVIEYTGNLPIIDSSDPSLMLYLTPKGRSNDAVDRDQWSDYNGKHIAKLSGMYYSNNSGWLEDADGVSYLQLTSGAKLTIPTFYPFAKDPTRPSNTDSSMGKGMTIELDFVVEGVTDYNANLIQCISKDSNNNNAVGFAITGNKAYFYNDTKKGGTSGSLVNMNLIEDKRIRLSFVIEPNDSYHPYPMCLTYLNGKISSAALYSPSDSFIDSSNIPAQLVISSEYAQIKVYGIRFYSSALADTNILNNYTASLATLEERQARFDSNNVYNDMGEIDYEDVSAEHYDLQIPYMTIVGGWKTDENDKWNLLSSEDVGIAGLPTGKKDYRMIDVSVVYPKTEYFKNHKNYSYKNVFENGLGMTDNFGNKPVNKTGCIMYAQGTSSMEYPVKNLRLRFRNKNDHFTVFPNISPVEIICMKADYMESSGSHNTGAANLVDDLYRGASMKTPGQQQFETEDDRIVTCIKGHPCLIFWSPTGEKGTFKFIGKYNLNLDKATPEPFGFNHDNSDFGYLKPGDEYYAINYKDDDVEFIGQEKPADGGDYNDTKEGEELKIVQEGQKINSIHCFEFLDNAVPVCNFLKRPKKYIQDKDGNLIPDPAGGYYTYEESWYNEFDAGKGETAPGWTFGFESRYPEDRVGYHDADMLYPLASWLSELYYLKTEGSKGDGQPTEKDINEANARFKNEYQAYLDKEFLLFYYIVTEALLMADSRVKNMMIATWGKKEYFYYPLTYKENIKYIYAGTVGTVDWDSDNIYYRLNENGEYVLAEKESNEEDYEFTIVYTQTTVFSWEPDKTKELQTTNFYNWYPIFYDMDTMLGLDNTGVNRFNYYDEDNDPSTYNGDEVLWNFVRDCLSSELDVMYSRLEPAGLNTDLNELGQYVNKSLIPYFNNNQANLANEAFYNGDAQYKYIYYATNRYWDGLNEKWVEAGEAPYLYAAQGDRSLDREYFITNRVKFLRGKHGSEDFSTKDRITFRLYYPTGQESNFTEVITNPDGSTTTIDHSASVSEGVAPPSDTFDFESLQTCYAGVLIGANGHVVKERFKNEERKSIKVQEAQSANGTEAYLLGVSNLKDLGDLSNKYPQKFIMGGKNKLRTLTFGNAHKDYYNPFWRPENGNSTPIGLSGCTYLQTFNMLNCKTYNAEVNFTNCPIIETILLTGSSASNIMLPVNGIIKEMRLPTTITKLSINSHQYLTKDNFSIGTYEYGSDNLIGGNGKYVNDYTYLTELTIINTPIDSYDMVSKASNLNGYYFEGFNWEIEGKENDNQYLKTSDAEWDSSKTYYIWDIASKTYVQATKDQFENNHGIIKEKYSLIENGKIVRIPILDYLYTKAARKDQIDVTKESALTGTITIKACAKVDQFELYQMYNGKYPNVILEYDEEAIGTGNLTKAYKVEFFNAPGVNANTEAYYTVLTDGNYTLSELISASGPAGINLVLPTMQSTTDTVFEFTNKWKVVNLEDPDAEEIIYDMDIDFENIKPTTNLKLEPIYISKTRYYPIRFYNYDGTYLKTVEYTYDQVMSENPETPMYLARNEKLENEFERYTFKGWINENDFNNLEKNPNPTPIDLESAKVQISASYYAYYVIEDARNVATSLQFFDIIPQKIEYKPVLYSNDGTEAGKGSIDLGTQYVISIKPIYHSSLSGKITLPNKDAAGHDITVVGALNAPNITEVYFLQNNKYIAISTPYDPMIYTDDGSFYYANSLTRVYFPQNMSNLKYIGHDAFRGTSELKIIDNLPDSIEYIEQGAFQSCQAELEKIPTNVKYIGSAAYRTCNNVTFKTLPVNLEVIATYAFYRCPRIEINNFGYDTNSGIVGATDNKVKVICNSAFYAGGVDGGGKNVTDLYLKNSITAIAASAFSDYGSSMGITVHDESGLITNENEDDIFGSLRPVTRA